MTNTPTVGRIDQLTGRTGAAEATAVFDEYFVEVRRIIHESTRCRNCKWWGKRARSTWPGAPHIAKGFRYCDNPKNADTCCDDDAGHTHHTARDFGCIHFEARE